MPQQSAQMAGKSTKLMESATLPSRAEKEQFYTDFSAKIGQKQLSKFYEALFVKPGKRIELDGGRIRLSDFWRGSDTPVGHARKGFCISTSD